MAFLSKFQQMKLIHRLSVFILLLCPILSSAQSEIELFNQKNLEGWYAYEPNTGKHENASELFEVDKNMIRFFGKEAGYLMSERSFHNFKLKVEFRWNTDSSFTRRIDTKNSGIMYLVPSDTPDQLWPKGIQFQVKEGSCGDFIFLHKVTLCIKNKTIGPGKSVVSKRFRDAANPVAEWNTVVIMVNNGKVTQRLNGKLVNQGREASVTSGHILLQYEGYPIDFRKVEIEKL